MGLAAFNRARRMAAIQQNEEQSTPTADIAEQEGEPAIQQNEEQPAKPRGKKSNEKKGGE